MRAKIVIDKFGTTRAGDTTEPPPGGVTAKRSNRDFAVKLDADVSYPALIGLIRTLRAVDAQMTLADDTDVLRILRLLEHIYTDDPTMQRAKH